MATSVCLNRTARTLPSKQETRRIHGESDRMTDFRLIRAAHDLTNHSATHSVASNARLIAQAGKQHEPLTTHSRDSQCGADTPGKAGLTPTP